MRYAVRFPTRIDDDICIADIFYGIRVTSNYRFAISIIRRFQSIAEFRRVINAIIRQRFTAKWLMLWSRRPIQVDKFSKEIKRGFMWARDENTRIPFAKFRSFTRVNRAAKRDSSISKRSSTVDRNNFFAPYIRKENKKKTKTTPETIFRVLTFNFASTIIFFFFILFIDN